MTDNSRLDDLRRRVQSDPASIAFAALAEEYRRAGAYEEAIATCKAGLQRHPAYLSARVTLGRALLEVNRFNEAREELEYVLKLAPENLAAIRALAEIHHRRGELPEEEHYKAALEVARRDAHADAAAAHAPQAHAPQASASEPAHGRPAPSPAPTHTAAVPAANVPTPAPRPVIQPVRVQPSAAPPAPAPAADPALAGLEAFLSAILRAKQDLESASLRS
jgi:tetratricopeptide (TPR) repeat protein